MFNDKSALIPNSLNEQEFHNFIKCCACSQVLINPVRCTKCHCMMCRRCAENLLVKSMACPSCRSPLNIEISKLMNMLLNSTKLRCINGCGIDIDYNKFTEHYTIDCAKLNFEGIFKNECKKREDEKNKLNALKTDIFNNISKIKTENEQFNEADIDGVFVSKYHYHPLIKNIFSGGLKCSVCSQFLERNSDKYLCHHCRFDYCNECKNVEIKEEI